MRSTALRLCCPEAYGSVSLSKGGETQHGFLHPRRVAGHPKLQHGSHKELENKFVY